MKNQPVTECIYCEGYIHAGKHPPFCSEYCEYWFKVEVSHERLLKADARKIRDCREVIKSG